MADEGIVQIAENTPEQVAHKLMHEIAAVERVSFYPSRGLISGQKLADRNWILTTYSACLLAVRNPSLKAKQRKPKPKGARRRSLSVLE